MYSFKSISKLLAILTLVSCLPAYAAKRVVNSYQTTAPADKVFSESVLALTHEGFVLKLVDKTQGTIQADKMAWGSATPAFSVFVTVAKESDGTSVEARFTKNPGIIGHSSGRWANQFGRELKEAFPDLTGAAEKR